jgi:tetratricopeptide (TPR) repeat protein
VHTLQRLSGILAALVAAIPVAASSAHSAESAAVSEAGVDRMIDLNKKAYADIQDQHFQAAKYRLSEALVISETAGLENDEMTARTYVHLAVVYLTGLKDREEAIQQFMLALRINPNITITPGLESPALGRPTCKRASRWICRPIRTQPLRFCPKPSPPGSRMRNGQDRLPSNKQPPAASKEALRAPTEPDLPARVPVPALLPPALRHSAWARLCRALPDAKAAEKVQRHLPLPSARCRGRLSFAHGAQPQGMAGGHRSGQCRSGQVACPTT